MDHAVRMKKLDADFLSILFALLLITFARMMPPFIGADGNELVVRLGLEISVLGGISIYLFVKQRLTPFVYLAIVFALYMMNWILSAEKIQHVLSHFNKFALLLLLSEMLFLSYPLASFLKKIWCVVWVIFSLMAIMVFVTHVSGLFKLINIGGNHNYYYFPYFGYAVMKFLNNGFGIPRYVGFLNEPIHFGFFAGFNMIIAQKLFASKKYARYFSGLNMVAGLLTFSYAFYLSMGMYLLLWRHISKIPSKYIYVGSVLFILFAAGLGNELITLPHSSQGDRLKRYHLALVYIQGLNLDAYLYGAGLVPFQHAIGRGSSSALIDVFVSRGIFIFFAWAYLLHNRCKYIPGLLFYIVFYSLFTNLWSYPLFIVGVAIATSYSKFKTHALSEQHRSRMLFSNDTVSI